MNQTFEYAVIQNEDLNLFLGARSFYTPIFGEVTNQIHNLKAQFFFCFKSPNVLFFSVANAHFNCFIATRLNYTAHSGVI